MIYNIYSKKKVVNNKILFVEPRLNTLKNSFQVLYSFLAENYLLQLHIHYLRKDYVKEYKHLFRCIYFVKDLATSKYLVLDEANKVLGSLKLRSETKVLQLWHGAGAFKKFGFSTADLIFGADRITQEEYPMYKNFNLVTVSSPEVMWAYEEAMNISHDEKIIKPLGISRTDVFFCKEYIENAYIKIQKIFPQSKGKKILLYAPTFRGRVSSAETSTKLDIGLLKQSFDKDYVLIIKHHPLVKNIPCIPEEYQSFAMDCTNNMAIDELLCITDICISDYSSLVFEFSLFEKPMIFYAYDLDDFNEWRGFYYDYSELTPGPVFTKNEEIVEYIRNIDSLYDKSKVRNFKEKFMQSCDGKSTERIYKEFFGSSLEQYRK